MGRMVARGPRVVRRVSELMDAKRLEERPGCIPVGRPRGVKSLGIRYEKSVALALPMAVPGVWWEYWDANGHGFCQTDLLVVGRQFALVLECKLSWTSEAWDQIEYLYEPVVARAIGRQVLGIQVCKNLFHSVGGGPVVQDLQSAIGLAKRGQRVTVHWRGLGPLWTPSGGGHARPLAVAKPPHQTATERGPQEPSYERPYGVTVFRRSA